jgi:uncharacterized protein involved in exopolysaccharide biosynthesis
MTENGAPVSEQFAYDRYPEVQRQTEVHHYVRLFLEYRWWIIGVTLAFALMGALKVFLATPLYAGYATVFIDIGTPAKDAELSKNYNQDYWAMSELFLNAQGDLIRSKEVAQEAAKNLHLENHPAFQGVRDPAEIFRHMIQVSRKKESALFTISVVCPYQQDVAAWTNAVAEASSRKCGPCKRRTPS